MSDKVGDVCAVCNKAGTRSCKQFKGSRYCSMTCQKEEWPTHKLLCAVFPGFKSSSRPTDEHYRAILFPENDAKPRFIWLHAEWQEEDEYEPKYQSVQKRELADTIRLCHRDTFLMDGSKPNKSIAAITATRSGQYHDWRGPLVAYGMKSLGIDQTRCRDLDMKDFRDVADYFLWYEHKPGPAVQVPTGKVVEGVRINCLGDRMLFDKPQFEAIEVPSGDLIFSEHDMSDIAKPLSKIKKQCFFICLAIRDPKWAGRGLDYNGKNNVGSVMVVRKNKKALAPLHVEALCRYCRYEIRPILAHSIGEYAPDKPLSKEAALAMVCRPTFSILWYKLLDEKRKNKENADAPFPYDVE
ncbi:MAG: hypothetical protein M1814_002142 [Vezdaea aestivalis]|nr:MAG: hypothetical protein M1814_002142 [Vezdaea aestivalis]